MLFYKTKLFNKIVKLTWSLDIYLSLTLMIDMALSLCASIIGVKQCEDFDSKVKPGAGWAWALALQTVSSLVQSVRRWRMV